MPAVDFSLEDIRRVVDESIDARFQIFEKSYEQDMAAIQEDFLALYPRLDKMDARLVRVEASNERIEAGNKK